jgi:hypothetical protein
MNLPHVGVRLAVWLVTDMSVVAPSPHFGQLAG